MLHGYIQVLVRARLVSKEYIDTPVTRHFAGGNQQRRSRRGLILHGGRGTLFSGIASMGCDFASRLRFIGKSSEY